MIGAHTTDEKANEWLSPSQALSQLLAPEPLTDAAVERTRTTRFGYRVGALGFLVGSGTLSELLPAPEIYPIPNVDASIRGYVNLQGSLVPVWDLHSLLDIGVSEDIDSTTQGPMTQGPTTASVLVLGRGDHRVGVTIDGLPRSLKQLEPVKRSPPPPESLDGFVTDAQIGDGSLWFEFDHEAFFQMQTQRVGR